MSARATPPVDAAVTAQPAAPVLPTTPQPGWTTTEFWTTVASHAVAALAVVLTLTGRSGRALTLAEAAVPLVALVASVTAHTIYTRSRGRLKFAHLGASTAELRVDLSKALAVLTPLAVAARPLISVTLPGTYDRVQEAVAAAQDAVTASAR